MPHATVSRRATYAYGVRWGTRAIMVAALVTAASLGGCSTEKAAAGCIAGRLVVTPHTASPGAIVTVRSESGGCNGPYPLVVQGPESPNAPYRVQSILGKTRPSRDGSFVVRGRLPTRMVGGQYQLTVDAPYPQCRDTDSCAVLQAGLTVEAGG
jgi:hypothetical protein